MKKKRKSLFDYITAFMGVVWLVSACSVDSDSWLPTIICLIASLWLGMYVFKTDKQGGDC
jgi:hypothetical protein